MTEGDGSASAQPAGGAQPLGGLDRVLGIFAEVKAGEAASALLLALDVCVLLSAYYVLKPVREALILADSGAELKTYAAFAQVLLLAAVVPGYSWLASRFERGPLIRTVTFIFVGCLVAFYFAAKLEMPGLGIVFFLWVGIFNLMVVAQFWAFASDLYSQKQGERLFAIVAFGASTGAVVGSHLTSILVKPLGVAQMMLVSAALLFVSLGLSRAAERSASRCSTAGKEGGSEKDGDSEKDSEEKNGAAKNEEAKKPEQKPKDAEKKQGRSAYRLVLQSRYLLLIGVLMLLANWVNTTGEFLLSSFVEKQVEQQFSGPEVKVQIGEFYSRFFFWVNLAGAVVQLFVTSRLIRHVGVRFALLVLPTIALFGYASVFLFPVLATVRWSKTAENATDYSLNNTVRNALFLPLSAEEKYKAKQVVDTIFVRGGDALTAALVLVGYRWLELPLSAFALFNVAVVCVWLWVAWSLGRLYAESKPEERRDGAPDSAAAGSQ